MWDRGLNIFALSACGLIILATSIGIVICHIPFRLLTFVMGARTETITRPLLSVIKYGCGIGALFYCLYLYRKAFQNAEMGYACALAWLLFIIVLALTLIVLKSQNRWVYYSDGGDN